MTAHDAYEAGRADGCEWAVSAQENGIPDDLFAEYARGVKQGLEERHEELRA